MQGDDEFVRREDLAEFMARYSALEFLAEVMTANAMAGLPKAQADAFLEDLCSPYRAAWSAGSEPPQGRQVEAMSRALEHVAGKVRDRADQIRARRVQGL